jgi:hypothetical protein
MAKTLYLLRRPIDHINSSLFLPSETEGTVVLLEQGITSSFDHSLGEIHRLSETSSESHISYDELIEKIFQHDRTIVI